MTPPAIPKTQINPRFFIQAICLDVADFGQFAPSWGMKERAQMREDRIEIIEAGDWCQGFQHEVKPYLGRDSEGGTAKATRSRVFGAKFWFRHR